MTILQADQYWVHDRVSDDRGDSPTFEEAKAEAEKRGLTDYEIIRIHQEVVFDSLAAPTV